MKKLLIVLLLFASKEMRSQALFKGQVIDASDNPIPFATVVSAKSGNGVVTNLEGEFEYRSSNPQTDTLVISHIGYVSHRVAISGSSSSKHLRISLKENTTILAEVVVLPPEYLNNAKKIVSKAIDKIVKESDKNPFLLEGFYRQIDIQDEQPKRLIEAALVIADPGYNQPKKTKFDFEEIRKSLDLRTSSSSNPTKYLLQDTSYSSRQINCWFKKNTKRASSHNLDKDGRNECGSEEYGLLNTDFINEHKFKLDTISSFADDLVYVIKVLPSRTSKQYLFPKGMVIPVGKLFIRADDFTLLKFEYSYILNPRKSNSSDFKIYNRIFGSRIIFQINAIFKDFDGSNYLFYLHTRDFHSISRDDRLEREKEHDKVYDLIEREYVVNKVTKYSDEHYESKISRKWNGDMFLQTVYNRSFWDNFNTTIENQDQKILRESLELKIKNSESK